MQRKCVIYKRTISRSYKRFECIISYELVVIWLELCVLILMVLSRENKLKKRLV